MGNIRFAPWLMLILPATALIAVITVFAVNRASSGGSTDDLDEYFLRDARAMQEMGLPVYWLGTGFEAGDLAFAGPYVSGFGAEVRGGGIHMAYLAPVNHGDINLYVTVYSRDAWALVRDSMMDPQLPGVTRTPVSIQGRDAELILQAAGARPLNAVFVMVDLDDVVVVADANSVGGATPGGPDYSPFINDPDLLVQVMQGLRPYPD